jgi:hypothetical protein
MDAYANVLAEARRNGSVEANSEDLEGGDSDYSSEDSVYSSVREQ